MKYVPTESCCTFNVTWLVSATTLCVEDITNLPAMSNILSVTTLGSAETMLTFKLSKVGTGEIAMMPSDEALRVRLITSL